MGPAINRHKKGASARTRKKKKKKERKKKKGTHSPLWVNGTPGPRRVEREREAMYPVCWPALKERKKKKKGKTRPPQRRRVLGIQRNERLEKREKEKCTKDTPFVARGFGKEKKGKGRQREGPLGDRERPVQKG